MLQFNAQEFAKLCFYLEQLQGDCLLDEQAADYSEQLQRWRDDVKARLHFLRRECERIGLASSVA
jgi:hypothetical protein